MIIFLDTKKLRTKYIVLSVAEFTHRFRYRFQCEEGFIEIISGVK